MDCIICGTEIYVKIYYRIEKNAPVCGVCFNAGKLKLRQMFSPHKLTVDDLIESYRINGFTLDEVIERSLKHHEIYRPRGTVLTRMLDCPRCRSINLQHLGNDRKAFSVGKALGGAVLSGRTGLLAGFAGKKDKRDRWRCRDCGVVFKK